MNRFRNILWSMVLGGCVTMHIGCNDHGKTEPPIHEHHDSQGISNESIIPLSSVLKKEIDGEISIQDLMKVLGPWQQSFGSGVSYLVWYFDDDTCLVVFITSAENERMKKLYWVRCRPGEFRLDMLKDDIGRAGRKVEPHEMRK